MVVPTDMPFLIGRLLHELVDGRGLGRRRIRDGPLPGAYSRSVLPMLERQIAAGRFTLHRALAGHDVAIVTGNLELLRNVNTLEDLPV